MRVFRNNLSWVLAFLFLMILINGCDKERTLSATKEAEYQADTSEYDKKTNKVNVDRAKDRLDDLVNRNAPDDQIEQAQLHYIELMQDYINPGPMPSRNDPRYDHDPFRSRTGHGHVTRGARPMPPVTGSPHPPETPKCPHHK